MKNISSSFATIVLAGSLAACGGGGDDSVHGTGPVEPINPPVVPPVIVIPPSPSAQDFAITIGRGVSDTMSGIVSRASVANLSVSNVSVSRSGTYADCVWDQANNILTITPRPSTEAPTDSCTLDLSDASGKKVSVLANLKDLDSKAPTLPSITPLSTTAGVTWTQVLPTATDVGSVTYSVNRADGTVVPQSGSLYTFDPTTRTLSGTTGITATETLSYIATDAVGNSTTQNIVNSVNSIGSISAPTLESKTSISINTAPGVGTGVNNPRVELYSNAGLTQLVATQASGDFSGLTPDTLYHAVTVVDDINEATGIVEPRRSVALSIKTDIAVIVDPAPVAGGAFAALTDMTVSDEAGGLINPISTGGVTDTLGRTIVYLASGLPTGLSINSSTGVISGIYDVNGVASEDFTVTITAQPTGGIRFINKTFVLSVRNDG